MSEPAERIVWRLQAELEMVEADLQAGSKLNARTNLQGRRDALTFALNVSKQEMHLQ